jgi:DNA-binding transcriptional ArsR family regulator
MDDIAAAEVTKALSHPLRLEYLRALTQRRQLSPSQFAEEVEEPLGNVSYHVKALFEADLLEVAELVPRRGALEHRYSFTGKRAGVAMALIDLLATA